MLKIQEEKKSIYKLLEKLIDEREEIDKQYLDSLVGEKKLKLMDSHENTKSISVLESERIRSQDYMLNKSKMQHHIFFERVAKNILAILKQHTEYWLCISYKNLACNILSKMLKERSLPINYVYSGYWQCSLSNL